MKYRSGAGDPARTLALLWRRGQAGARGPKPTLTLDRVVGEAIALADAEGLDALSMRSLAKRLGVAPMALYTYLPGKEELLDLMLDAVFAGMLHQAPAAETWRARLEAVADENRALFRRHPWLIEVSTVRPPLGPGQVAKYEHELRALEGCGLPDVEQDTALTVVLGFVESCARIEAGQRAAAARMSDHAWWEASAPLLAEVLDPARFPVASRVGSAAGAAHGAAYDAEHTYRFGLSCLLDGLAARLVDGAHVKPARGS